MPNDHSRSLLIEMTATIVAAAFCSTSALSVANATTTATTATADVAVAVAAVPTAASSTTTTPGTASVAEAAFNLLNVILDSEPQWGEELIAAFAQDANCVKEVVVSVSPSKTLTN